MIANAIGKRRQQAHAAKHEPGLVAVPDRRDRVHHQVTRGRVGREAEQDPDAKVEAVEQHIEENPDAKDDRPDQDEIQPERQRGHRVVPPGARSGQFRDRMARPAALHLLVFRDHRLRPAADDARHHDPAGRIR